MRLTGCYAASLRRFAEFLAEAGMNEYRGEDRRHDDAAFDSLRNAISDMLVTQKETIAFLKSDSNDFKEWRKTVDKSINSHTNQLNFLKGISVAVSAFIGWLGVDRVIGK